jgi:hypothetical protein
MNALGIRAGYTEPVNSYAFRRGFGNRIDGKFPYSRPRIKLMVVRASQICKEATGNGPRWRSPVWLVHHQKIGIDVQKAVRCEAQDTTYMDHVRCITFTRDLKTPTHASLGRRVSREDLMPVIMQNPHLSMGRLRSKARKERLKKARADHLKNSPPLSTVENAAEGIDTTPSWSRFHTAVPRFGE